MKAIYIIGLFALSSLAQAQNPEAIIASFFDDYQNATPEAAIDHLYARMPQADKIRDDINQIKIQFAGLQNLVGAYSGNELIVKKEVGGSYVIYSYLAKYERQPIRFIFQFYKPGDTWGLHGFSYDDDLDNELEEAVKLYNLELGH